MHNTTGQPVNNELFEPVAGMLVFVRASVPKRSSQELRRSLEYPHGIPIFLLSLPLSEVFSQLVFILEYLSHPLMHSSVPNIPWCMHYGLQSLWTSALLYYINA